MKIAMVMVMDVKIDRIKSDVGNMNTDLLDSDSITFIIGLFIINLLFIH